MSDDRLSTTTRVLVVTAAMGAGHLRVADELTRRLRVDGARTETLEVISAAGRSGERLRRTYRFLLAHAPWLYDAAMRFWVRFPRPMERLTALGAGPFERAIREAVADFDPDVVVSTYDLASQALGRLKHADVIRIPVVTLVVDSGAHPYWISPYVEHHLVLTELTAARLRCRHAGGVQLVQPVLRPEFDRPEPRDRARVRLDVPAGARVAVVTGGSWAAGALETTVTELAANPSLLVLVLCGHDDALRARLGKVARVRPIGWTDEVADYLVAADLVLDNAGGLTCWEALAAGTPVLLYRVLPGHGRFNAAVLHEAGLARWLRRPEQLRAAVEAAAGTRGRLPPTGAAGDAVACILAAAPDSHRSAS